MEFETYKGRAGVWVIYSYDHIPQAESIHKRSVDALVALTESMGSLVAFWPIGWSFQDAVKDWEDKARELSHPRDEGCE